jgi:endonuclease/exonuclease/phosphatase family metal-dependent hydrolase
LRKVLIKILIILNILAVLALLASYISVYIPPNRAWIPAFIGLAYPFFLGINVLFIIIWLILRIRYALLSFMAIAVGFGFFNRFIQWRGKSSDATDVKVMSYNVQYFRGDGNNLDRKQNVEHIVSFLAEQNADIICLQESRLRRNDIFNLAKTVQDLKNIKHYQFARSSNTFGSVTMTRYPIIDMGEIRFEHSRNITIYTDMQIGEDTVRVYNIHLQSYHIEPKDYAVLENVEIQEEKNRKVFRKVAIQMKDAFERRALQANEVRKHINDCKYKVIVCGDFNDTPTSYSYHTISGDLSDAFVDSGKGIGRTYAGELPSFRIDYILHSKTIKSYNFETLDFKFSDHLPIVCDLAMND